MSKISDRIRAAALGPAPGNRHVLTIGSWLLGGEDMSVAYEFKQTGYAEMFSEMPEHEQRMFLLFVAEALE
jgi:hypothetical protein